MQNLFSAQKAEAEVLPSLLTLCSLRLSDKGLPTHRTLKTGFSQSIEAILMDGVPLNFSKEFQCSYVQFS